MTDYTAIKRLFSIDTPCGYAADDIRAAVDRYGALPRVLQDYYLELGCHHALNQTQDSLHAPNQLEIDASGAYLVFYSENQRACVWGIRCDSLMQDDPQVFMSEDEEEWRLESETLREFLLAMACLQAVFALPYNSESFYFIEEEGAAFIRDHYNDKKVILQQWIGISFYGNSEDSVIAVMRNGEAYNLIYAAADPFEFQQMDRVLSELGEEM